MDIFGDIIVAILEIITPHNTYDSDYNMVQIGCTLVVIYFLMMFTAIGMGIWVLTVNVPAGIALIVFGAILFIGSLIGFIKIFFGKRKKK